MARFAIGQPISTREPFIQVDAGLRPGVHRFRLEVVTADGRISPPDEAEVTVIERTIDPLNLVLRDIVRDVVRDLTRD